MEVVDLFMQLHLVNKSVLFGISIFLFTVTSILAQDSKIFLIDFTIDKNDIVRIERFLITDGTPIANDFNSEYSAKMFSRDKILYFTDFIVDFIVDEQVEEPLFDVTENLEERTLDRSYITLKFPADRSADTPDPRR